MFFLTGMVLGVELREKEVMERYEKLKKSGVLKEKMLRKIEEQFGTAKELHEKTREKVKEWEVKEEGGKVKVRRKEKREVKERVYVFMSSSVPKEVWEVYMDYALQKKVPAVFILRGCVGGCRYVRPTIDFIRDVLGERPLEVWIDPVKFREYGVKAVPCVAVEGKEKLSCGDWSMEYHLKELGVW